MCLLWCRRMAAASLLLVIGELYLDWMAARMAPSASSPGSSMIHHALGARDLVRRHFPAFQPKAASSSVIIWTWREIEKGKMNRSHSTIRVERRTNILPVLVPCLACALPVDPAGIGEEPVLGDNSALSLYDVYWSGGFIQKAQSNSGVELTMSRAALSVGARR